MERVELGVDGNCGFALLGENLQEGEAEFEEFIGDIRTAEGMQQAKLAINRAYRRLITRLGRPISYYLGASHPDHIGCGTTMGSERSQSATGDRRVPMTKHTPGPWHAVLDPGWIPWHGAIAIIAGDFDVTWLTSTTNERERDEANARLIAAAPDMLVALQLADAERDYLKTELQDKSCSDLCDKTFEQQGCPSGTCAKEAGIARFNENTRAIRAAIAKATGE